MHEQTAMLVGEGKHGVWRFQENGFIRIYRGVGKEGIPPQKREGVRDLRENVVIDDDMEDKESAWEINRLLIILERNYMPIDPNFEFNHQFGEEVFEPNGRNWLNWIDLPIYHARFAGKYKEHVPIDLPVYYCQVKIIKYNCIHRSNERWLKIRHKIKTVEEYNHTLYEKIVDVMTIT